MPRFKARLQPEGPRGAWTFLRVPFDVHKTFGSRARVAVRGTINGFEYRSSIFPDGEGHHHMMVNKAMQAGAKAAPNQTVSVSMEVDDVPRQVRVPSELSRALKKDTAARKFFQTLSSSCRREYADWISQAKKQETRDRRALAAIQMLLGGRKRVTM